MAGPHPSPRTRLLLAALLSMSLPGHVGKSSTSLQHPAWYLSRHCPHTGASHGVLPGHSLSHSTTNHCPL